MGFYSECPFMASVQFSHSVVSDSLRPHELQHARPPCPSPSLQFTQTHIHQVSDAIQLSHLCRPLFLLPPIPPSITVFSSSQLFAWGGQSTGVSASTSVLPKITQGWSPLEWTGWIQSKASILWHSAFYTVQLSHPYMTTGKTIALTIWTFVSKVMFLVFWYTIQVGHSLLPQDKRLLISWLQSPSAMIVEPQKVKSVTVSTVSHLFAMKWQNLMPCLHFLNVEL